jgi:hypothetical protein
MSGFQARYRLLPFHHSPKLLVVSPISSRCLHISLRTNSRPRHTNSNIIMHNMVYLHTLIQIRTNLKRKLSIHLNSSTSLNNHSLNNLNNLSSNSKIIQGLILDKQNSSNKGKDRISIRLHPPPGKVRAKVDRIMALVDSVKVSAVVCTRVMFKEALAI